MPIRIDVGVVQTTAHWNGKRKGVVRIVVGRNRKRKQRRRFKLRFVDSEVDKNCANVIESKSRLRLLVQP